ncbi:unnamed protein product [Prorocentrum cordatum]|uniref:Uncharacterized protein n=1 Tax=Prorocentrum cordatum TaxID=2364126 RepID=A0ABN9XMB5_9DINO|nr:unnamed protein product [Polarella glacialis]
MLSPYDMLQEPTGDSSSPKLVPSSFPTATQAEWQRDPTSVAGYFARIKEVEVAACVEMQRLKEQGSVERCRITEEHRSRRYDRWADTAKATASEDASTHREAIAANREVAQHAISTSAWVEESQARSRSSLLPGPVAWPWSALAANVVLWGGMRRLGLRSWRGAVVWLVLWALALRKARLDVLGNAQADLQARKGAALHGLPEGLRQVWQQRSKDSINMCSFVACMTMQVGTVKDTTGRQAQVRSGVRLRRRAREGPPPGSRPHNLV